MTQRILYCGDTTLDTAAAYLASLLTLWQIEFEYVPSDQPLPADLDVDGFDLFVFSDYSAARAGSTIQQRIVDRVAAGTSVLMIGGWESFHGLGGDWDGTPIGDALPVEISSADDRMNCDSPVFVRPSVDDHPVIRDLPWANRPPLIGGFNRVTAKPSATVLLEAVRMAARSEGNTFVVQAIETHPLLVVAESGSGKVAVLATDVAPHWIGPMVDWGESRVTARAGGTDGVEVGNRYAQFLQQLVTWL
ncbi:hypothetical protein GC176_26690 [bacterium]|nr:hypothetical protein [bacterium]